MRVYVASKSRHAPFWTALRSLGLPIVASWIDSPINHKGGKPTDDDWSKHWARCISEASASDVLLFVALEGETQCGSLIELGSALSQNKRVFLVSDYEWSIAHHPRCQRFATLAAAVEAIMVRLRSKIA